MVQAFRYNYSDTEVKKILATLMIIVDTREKENQHVTDYLDKKGVPYMKRTLKTGDYGCIIPKNEELGIMRDIQLTAAIERKAHIDEITGNLSKLKATAFENELIRSADVPFVLVCEDPDGYGKILRGEYRSQYDPKALLGRLKTFEARYGFSIVYLDKAYTGNYIYHHFYYAVMECVKKGLI